jgi:hypothetical protein
MYLSVESATEKEYDPPTPSPTPSSTNASTRPSRPIPEGILARLMPTCLLSGPDGRSLVDASLDCAILKQG